VDKHQETRERLLLAAGEVFAEKGFRSATVREICRRAGANVAAVNYHFGDKERLHYEVLKYLADLGERRYPPDLGLESDPSGKQRLHAFVRSFLFRILGSGRPAWHGRLMAREIIEPTASFDAIIENVYRPLDDYLMRVVKEVAGPRTSQEEILRSTRSVLGQCLFYYHSQRVVKKLAPDFRLDEAEIERLAGHITRFSLAGIRHIHLETEEER
jgi:AcrR family transcriptional regulator